MKRFVLVKCVMILFSFISIVNAGATSFSFTETFLAGDAYFDVQEGWNATFAFDLTAKGDYATLKDENGTIKKEILPNPDVEDFIPYGYTIETATLDFTFSSRDTWDDTVTIKAGFMDGNRLITEKEYDLGVWYNCNMYSANLSLDLLALGFADYLNDGKFDSVVLALGNGCPVVANDFRIDDATLQVLAHAPEPGTFLMMGVGLIGLGTLFRKKTPQR